MTRALPLLFALGCGTETADTGTTKAPADGCTPTWDGWTDGFMATWCRTCHSETTPNRHDAPEGVDFDTRQQVLDQADRIRARVLDERTMPLGGGVPDEELELLEAWLTCASS